MQLIFILETDNKSQSDFMYINSTIHKFYKIEGHKVTPIFTGGKGNYNKVESQIKKYKGKYSGNSIVYICYDVDNQIKPTYKLNDEIEKYACTKGYKTIWFNEDIEQAYIKTSIPDNKKTKRAKEFINHNEIYNVNIISLSQKNVSMKCSSNILFELDKVLKRNNDSIVCVK